MKPHEPKKRIKQERKRGETNGDKKNQIKKRRKGNKTLSQKKQKGVKNFDKKTIKKKEPKIMVLTHELLASTLLSNASFLVIYQSFKSLFTDFSHVKFGRHLLLFSCFCLNVCIIVNL
jgi:hypothetical protein